MNEETVDLYEVYRRYAQKLVVPILREQRNWFRGAGQMELRPSRTVTIMSGTGLAHHFVQAAHEPDRPKQEQDLETANILLQTAQMMAASAGAVMMTQPGPPPPPPPPEGATQ